MGKQSLPERGTFSTLLSIVRNITANERGEDTVCMTTSSPLSVKGKMPLRHGKADGVNTGKRPGFGMIGKERTNAL